MSSIFKITVIKCFMLFAILGVCCNPKENEISKLPEIEIPFHSQFTLTELSDTDEFSSIAKKIDKVDLNEVSGIAESKVNVNSLWAHNVSGNEEILYLLHKTTGTTKSGYLLKGTTNEDWEDIEVGPGPEIGKSYIYLADIGDNNQTYPMRTIYRFEEPIFEEEHKDMVMDWSGNVVALNFVYPDGSKDAETLLLDHETRDLYIISKRDYPARLYFFPFPPDVENQTTLILAGTLPLFVPVGGNVSSSGNEILIKTYNSIFIWKHTSGFPLWKTLAQKPYIAPYNPQEPQGEAICFDSSGDYFTLSERDGNEDAILYQYKRN